MAGVPQTGRPFLRAWTPAAPPHEPGARGVATPGLVTDWNAVTGEASIAWSAACGASDHALLAGPLAGIATRAWDTVHCGLGVDGPATVALGAGDRFPGLVGRTSVNDGSAGRDSFGMERPGAGLLLDCALPQLLGEPCP